MLLRVRTTLLPHWLSYLHVRSNLANMRDDVMWPDAGLIFSHRPLPAKQFFDDYTRMATEVVYIYLLTLVDCNTLQSIIDSP